MGIAQIKELALALSAADRAELADTLWESLADSPRALSDEFLAELQRRDEAGSEGCKSHDEVMAEARKLLAG